MVKADLNIMHLSAVAGRRRVQETTALANNFSSRTSQRPETMSYPQIISSQPLVTIQTVTLIYPIL